MGSIDFSSLAYLAMFGLICAFAIVGAAVFAAVTAIVCLWWHDFSAVGPAAVIGAVVALVALAFLIFRK